MDSRQLKYIIDYLNSNVSPDYGFHEKWEYQEMLYDGGFENWEGEVPFFVNDVVEYIYNLDSQQVWIMNNEDSIFYEMDKFFGNAWEPVFMEWFEYFTGFDVSKIIRVSGQGFPSAGF